MMELSHLTKTFGNGRGIFDVDFSVERGEVFGYLGQNGAGKTTTIRHLMGFLRPDEGACSIFGRDCFADAETIAEKLGYLSGEPVFFRDLTGEKYLEFMAGMRRMKSRKRMHELMDLFELKEFGPVRKLSKGMRQKLGLIGTFMDEPEAVILDEPTSGLDPLMQGRFVELILEEKKKGTTVLMSSHMFEEIEKTCDRAAIIREGHIVDTFQMQELAKRRQKIYTVQFSDEEAAGRFVKRTGEPDGWQSAVMPAITVTAQKGSLVEMTVGGPPAALLGVLSGAGISDLTVRAQSLEELFLQYYQTRPEEPGHERRTT